LERSENEEIFNLIKSVLNWLFNKDYPNAVLKWDISAWGKIPANLDREHPLINPCQQTVQQLKIIEHSVNLTASRSIEQRVNIVIYGKTYPVKEQLNKAGLS
jgi:hypothetical protein